MRVFAESDESEVVISGMSGRFPNSRNIADLDYHLYNKVGARKTHKVTNLF